MQTPTVTERSDSGAQPDGYAWDWSSTSHQGSDGIVDDLLAALGAETVTAGKGKQGWAQCVQAFDAGGYKAGAVYFGGSRDDVFVESTSMAAHDARAAVVGIGDAKTSRVDTKVDTLVPFDELKAMCLGLGGRGTKIALWESLTLAGEGEDPEAGGRTIYVGAPSSAVRIRIYEKWLESPGLYVEGCNRVEVQLRPPSRGKALVSSWGPAETFCASKLTRRLAVALEQDVATPASLQKSKGTPDLERTMEAMGEQYGKAFRQYLNRSGGDYSVVLRYLDAE